MLDDLKTVSAILKFFGFTGWEPQNDYMYRFNIQKIAYLCKVMGINLDSYTFSIYLHGPFSQALANDYKAYPTYFTADSRDHSRDHKFSPEDREHLRHVKDVIFNKTLMQDHPAEFLEAVSTLVFFIKNDNDYSHDSLVEKVKDIKPHLSVRILSMAVNVAKELLLPTEPLSPAFKEELSEWEKVGDGLEADVDDSRVEKTEKSLK